MADSRTDPAAARAALRVGHRSRSQAVRRLNLGQKAVDGDDESAQHAVRPSLPSSSKRLRYCDLLDDANPDEFQSPRKEGSKTTEESFKLRKREEGWAQPDDGGGMLPLLRSSAPSSGADDESRRSAALAGGLLLPALLLLLSLCLYATSPLRQRQRGGGHYGGPPLSPRREYERHERRAPPPPPKPPRKEGYIYTESSMLLRGHSLRQFGPAEERKFAAALAHALGVSGADVHLLAASLGRAPPPPPPGEQGLGGSFSWWWSSFSFSSAMSRELEVQFEVAVPSTVDLAQHTLHLSRLSHSGILQRLLRDLAGVSCKSLETRHTIRRPGR